MKLLILCGVWDEKNEQEVLDGARRAVEFSANLMQKKLIDAFSCVTDNVKVLSAPFLGAYPTASSIRVFRAFSQETDYCTYVPFINLWGVRNFSRARALKRAMRDFLADPDPDKRILCYCPHTPFLKAAAAAKKQDPSIFTCLYVPDLPQYMNLSSRVSFIYKAAKFFDIRSMTRAMKYTDSFVLLTEQMKDKLPVGDKPYLVCEGLVTESALTEAETRTAVQSTTRDIVYTGKLDERFGLRTLADAMKYIPDKDCRLILCGTGDALPYMNACAKQDPRILVLGQVTPKEARAWQQRAAVLVNPRSSTEEYTKYSFPSKNLEYLLCGAPVVAHKLAGMGEIYRSLLFAPACTESTGEEPHTPPPSPEEALAESLRRALSCDGDARKTRHAAFLSYAKEHLLATKVAQKILEMRK